MTGSSPDFDPTAYSSFYVIGGSMLREYSGKNYTGTVESPVGSSKTAGMHFPQLGHDSMTAMQIKQASDTSNCLTASGDGVVSKAKCSALTAYDLSQLWCARRPFLRHSHAGRGARGSPRPCRTSYQIPLTPVSHMLVGGRTMWKEHSSSSSFFTPTPILTRSARDASRRKTRATNWWGIGLGGFGGCTFRSRTRTDTRLK